MSYYSQITKSGTKIKRSWLCYSPQLNKVYCQPCWLFSSSDNSLITGCDDWQHLSGTLSVHQQSKAHLDASRLHEMWRSGQTVDEMTNEASKNEQNYWRQVLQRIVNVTLTLAEGNISFRGHRENLNDTEQGAKGNFLGIIRLLAKYDPLLADLLQKPEGSIKYLHHRNHDGIIKLLSEEVTTNIIKKINNCAFFSVIIDTTQDISKMDQLSQVFRYVTIQKDANEVPEKIILNESFLGFHKVTDQHGEQLSEEIINCIESHGLDLTKLCGQSYDGAANMSGVYSGVQARLKQRQPLALYIHCTAHNLNLTLNDSCNDVSEIRNFYDMLEKLYVFFSSARCWATLQERAKVSLKRVITTRWSSRIDALSSLRTSYTTVLVVLAKLELSPNDRQEQTTAAGLKSFLEDFNTVLVIVFQSKVLCIINPVSQLLQREQQDLSTTASLLQKAGDRLASLRNSFEEVKEEACILGATWGVKTEHSKKRTRVVPRQFDEKARDHRLEDPLKRFQINVFNASIDIMISQLKKRFSGIDSVAIKFKCLSPTFLSADNIRDEAVLEEAQTLADTYSSDLGESFPEQLISFRALLKEDLKSLQSVMDLAEFLILKNNSLLPSFPDIYTSLLLFLTLPVSVAKAERSFSKLKLIKTYLRNSMVQERLSGLAVISIENQEARLVDTDKIVDGFARLKARKKKM